MTLMVLFDSGTRRDAYRAPAAFARIQAAMAARLRQEIEESEKDDWSKQAAAEMERALCRLDNWPLNALR